MIKHEEEVKEWLKIANDDYGAAKYLFGKKQSKPLEIICYHCQQCAEKSFKAYLCSKGVEIPKTHGLKFLCHRCADFQAAFTNFFEDCEDLEVYATKARYPSLIEIEEINAKTALRQARLIFNFVSKLLEDEMGMN